MLSVDERLEPVEEVSEVSILEVSNSDVILEPGEEVPDEVTNVQVSRNVTVTYRVFSCFSVTVVWEVISDVESHGWVVALVCGNGDCGWTKALGASQPPTELQTVPVGQQPYIQQIVPDTQVNIQVLS